MSEATIKSSASRKRKTCDTNTMDQLNQLTKDLHNMCNVVLKTKETSYQPPSRAVDCIICLNEVTKQSDSPTMNCGHTACRSCLKHYLDSLFQTRRYSSIDKIECSVIGCKGYYKTEELLRRIYPKQKNMRDAWWNTAISKTFIANKVTCPFKECGSVFDVDETDLKECTFGVCLSCERGLCLVCQSPWHPPKKTTDGEDAALVLKEARKRHWMRCPHCSEMIEKSYGCQTIWCKCGGEFCYSCGSESNGHLCSGNCHRLTDNQLDTVRLQNLYQTQARKKAKTSH